jgi:hypothetical protein
LDLNEKPLIEVASVTKLTIYLPDWYSGQAPLLYEVLDGALEVVAGGALTREKPKKTTRSLPQGRYVVRLILGGNRTTTETATVTSRQREGPIPVKFHPRPHPSSSPGTARSAEARVPWAESLFLNQKGFALSLPENFAAASVGPEPDELADEGDEELCDEELDIPSPQSPEGALLWFRAWELRIEPDGWNWRPMPKAGLVERSANRGPLTLNLPGDRLTVLQYGCRGVPSQCVVLPSTRVVLSPHMKSNPVGKGSGGAMNFEVDVDLPEARANSLLDLMLAGDIHRAEKMSHVALAEKLFAGKWDDPVSAVVGGYYLLLVDALERFHDWSRNLSRGMPWMSDGAIIHGWFLLRSRTTGRSSTRNVAEAHDQFELAMKRG